jgi:hypothetical protein
VELEKVLSKKERFVGAMRKTKKAEKPISIKEKAQTQVDTRRAESISCRINGKGSRCEEGKVRGGNIAYPPLLVGLMVEKTDHQRRLPL